MSKKYKYDISIIIPVYNVEKYLKECIDSLIKQNYEFSKMEVILVNDGSVDNSLEICKEYETQYDNIKVVDQPNSGVSVSRNNGIEKATGKYIMLLDSDDFISKDAIKRIVSFFDEHYDEIDLLTYPLYLYNGKTAHIHNRYTAYDKGTGVYDLREYIYLNQNTVNIVIKNLGKEKIYYDKDMMLSEDQKFNTELLMKKEKIGYVENAIYYYRRVGAGASSIKNNPYICFEDIINYNEWLLEHFKKNGKIPKYIQSLVIHTINWRLNSDKLYPYAYKEKDYNKALKRVHNLVKQIDVDVIGNSTIIPPYNKIYFLKIKNKEFDISIEDNSIHLTCDGISIYENDKIAAEITRFKLKNNKLYIFMSLVTPFLVTNKIDVFLETVDKNNKKESIKMELLKSNRLYKACDDYYNKTYNIETYIDVNKIKKYRFYGKMGDNEVDFHCYFNRFSSGNRRIRDKVYTYKEKRKYPFKISKNIFFNSQFVSIKTDLKTLTYNRKAYVVRILSKIYPVKGRVYLYNDRHDGIDNAYYQFKHDFNKNDGVARYYICNLKEEDLKELFTEEERKYILKYKSFKHKMLFLKCEKIYTSFVDLQIYCPYNRGISKYRDIKKYDLIYLQHGILHANLISMYSKEFKEIDKFVISSNFEKNNLINNYNYKEEDLIPSTMPRMGEKKNNEGKAKRKILFAPSWRKYLIGALIENQRALLTPNFMASNFYNNINNLLKSKSFNELLKKEDLILDFKLHPIFKGYKDLFYTNDRIKISFDNVDLSDYNLFITDFSSFQFDYIKLQRPIIYYLPDYDEFVSGMHTYRKLDLNYKDAFGKLYTDPKGLEKEIKNVSNNNFKVDKVYKERMRDFFYKVDDPCEVIYNDTN